MQNAFHEEDTYTSMEKQKALMAVIMHLHERMGDALQKGAPPTELFSLPVREEISRAKFIPESRMADILAIRETIDAGVKELVDSSAGALVSGEVGT